MHYRYIYRDGTAIQMTFGNLRRQYVTIFGVAGAVTSKPKDIIMSEVKTYFMAGSVLWMPPKFHTLWTSIILTTIVYRVICSLGYSLTAKSTPLLSGVGRGSCLYTSYIDKGDQHLLQTIYIYIYIYIHPIA